MLIEGILLYSFNYFVYCIVVELIEIVVDNIELEKVLVKSLRKKLGIYE